jgi:transcriptional regulator with XRE-family HTH domain
MNALSRLIRARLAELDISYAEAGRRGGMPGNTISALALRGQHKQTPRPATLSGLAKALDVPLEVVRAAAAEAAGYHLEEIEGDLATGSRARIVVARMQEMNERDQEILLQMAENFSRTFRAQRGEERPLKAVPAKPARKRSARTRPTGGK